MDYLKLFVESPVFPVLVVIAGWFAINWLSARAQKRHFQNELMNSARLEIAGTLSEYEQWLALVYAALRMPMFNWPPPGQAQDEYRKIMALTYDRRAGTWITSLEQYELLFPETADVRSHLVARSSAIEKHVRTLGAAYLKPEDHGALVEAKDQAMSNARYTLDQVALARDLLRHLQNKSLSAITGRSIPDRIPELGPHLILRNKKLEIVERTSPPDSD